MSPYRLNQSGKFCLSTIANQKQTITFHKRELPTSLIALSSLEGKKIFREALDLGGMESFFPLSEQFITQSEPSFCSLSSLAMVLNALKYDPKKVWKGAWRWISEETLQCESVQICGHSLDRIKQDGMNFNEFVSLAHCHGVNISAHRAIESHEEDYKTFLDHIHRISYNSNANEFIIANFSRKFLGQTGNGHFSPIGGYHKEKNLLLIMDVARFKYPPYWVSANDLWSSMLVPDSHTKLPRGYFIVSIGNNSSNHSSSNVIIPPCQSHS